MSRHPNDHSAFHRQKSEPGSDPRPLRSTNTVGGVGQALPRQDEALHLQPGSAGPAGGLRAGLPLPQQVRSDRRPRLSVLLAPALDQNQDQWPINLIKINQMGPCPKGPKPK